MKRLLTFKINNNEEDTIENFLKIKLDISDSLLRKIKLHPQGLILNKNRAFTNKLLTAGDILEVLLESDELSSPNIYPAKGELDIIYEDEDLLIINKPPFLPVHPSKGHVNDSLANIIAYHYNKEGKNFIFRCVNRLDKDTSGIIAIAKNAYSHDQLTKQMKNGTLSRTYNALVHGKVSPDKGSITKNIRRVPDKATIKREVCDGNVGETAITNYQVIKYCKNNVSLLKISLQTGRTHQIRVHFSDSGHPLLGDWLYGDKDTNLINRQALHSTELSLLQPITKEPLKFVSPLPQDMQKLL